MFYCLWFTIIINFFLQKLVCVCVCVCVSCEQMENQGTVYLDLGEMGVH